MRVSIFIPYLAQLIATLSTDRYQAARTPAQRHICPNREAIARPRLHLSENIGNDKKRNET